MQYEVGDKVIHWAYGVGEIVQIDTKKLGGQDGTYYKVQVRDLTIWVPVKETNKSSLRPPTSARKFKKALEIFRETGIELSNDRLERKNWLSESLRSGCLEDVCRVIRDLSAYAKAKKLNDNDSLVLERAKNLLLEEWRLSLDIPLAEAQKQLKSILDEGGVNK